MVHPGGGLDALRDGEESDDAESVDGEQLARGVDAGFCCFERLFRFARGDRVVARWVGVLGLVPPTAEAIQGTEPGQIGKLRVDRLDDTEVTACGRRSGPWCASSAVAALREASYASANAPSGSSAAAKQALPTWRAAARFDRPGIGWNSLQLDCVEEAFDDRATRVPPRHAGQDTAARSAERTAGAS